MGLCDCWPYALLVSMPVASLVSFDMKIQQLRSDSILPK